MVTSPWLLRVCFLLLLLGGVAGETGATEGPAKAPRAFALPTEVEHDFGATNGEATLLRFLPLYRLPLSARWNLINLNILALIEAPGGVPGRPGSPDPVPGERAAGLGDLVHGSFVGPAGEDGFLWGLGMILSVPTATDPVLGSGKWTAGPAVRLTYRAGPWNVGAVAGQRWSFAGDSARPDLSALMVRGTFRFRFGDAWYLISAPVVTANWNAPSGEQWLVPLGGGVGRTLPVGSHRWAVSLQAYGNAVRPTGAPASAIRLQIVFAFPK